MSEPPSVLVMVCLIDGMAVGLLGLFYGVVAFVDKTCPFRSSRSHGKKAKAAPAPPKRTAPTRTSVADVLGVPPWAPLSPPPSPKRLRCPVDNCRIQAPHSHAEALLRQMRATSGSK